MSYIKNIATAVPDYAYGQNVLMQFYSNATDDESAKRKIKILAAKSGISTRYSVLKDYGLSLDAFTFSQITRNFYQRLRCRLVWLFLKRKP
jgi:predicted naringenin-chalcone synthase